MPESKISQNFAELSELVQSKILRALLGELRGGVTVADQPTLYTMSCGRNYGMYQKAQAEFNLAEEVERLAEQTKAVQAEVGKLRNIVEKR